MSKLKKHKSKRGFDFTVFRDYNDNKCSLQESSLANKRAIWLGIDDPKPQQMCPGIGWQPFKIPGDVLLQTRMHLTQKQVKKLLPHLKRFVKKGEL